MNPPLHKASEDYPAPLVCSSFTRPVLIEN